MTKNDPNLSRSISRTWFQIGMWQSCAWCMVHNDQSLNNSIDISEVLSNQSGPEFPAFVSGWSRALCFVAAAVSCASVWTGLKTPLTLMTSQIAHRLTILFSVRSNIKALLLRLRAGSDSEMVRHTSTGHHSIVLILHFSMRRSKTHVSHCFVCMAREYKFELKPIFYIVIIDGFMRLLLLWAECDNCGGGGGIRPISSSSHCAYFTD